MRCQYICPKHAAEVQHNEFAAIKLWHEFMKRGAHDYSLCRWDKAHAFLETAFEIAALRVNNNSNAFFSGANLLEPFEFMFEMCLSNDDFNNATNHLIQAFSLIGAHSSQAISTEIFALQKYSLKLKDKIEESTMLDQNKQRLMCICEKIYFYEEDALVH